MTRHAHQRALSWVVIAIGASGQGYGHCGEVGHRHDEDGAYRCEWEPRQSPGETFSMLVREVLIEPGGQLMLGAWR